MAQWAPNPPNSSSIYLDVLSKLRTIQLDLDQYEETLLPGNILIPTNRAFLSACLESLFCETVGTVQAGSFQYDNLIADSESEHQQKSTGH
jgi:hypothetical protein